MHNARSNPSRDVRAAATRSCPLLHAHSLTVRPAGRDDADLLVRFGLALSPETRYQRFLGGGVRFTPDLLRRLLDLDPARDALLVAVVTLDGRELPVGFARFAQLDASATAEFALTVADSWQGCGVGRILLDRLIDLARERGLRALVGDTLATNTPMLRLARSFGFAVRPHEDGATLKRLELDLCDELSAFVGRAPPAADGDA
jgi:acetyltransferase